jgi:ribose 5-phosphate isomerase B
VNPPPDSFSRIALASDHAGFALKSAVKEHLTRRGFAIQDFGASDGEPSDYPDYIVPAAEAVAAETCDLGVVFGGSGNGEAIAANKVRGIRCAVCWSTEIARLARRHNDANVIALPARFLSVEEANAIVDAWLGASFEGDRHVRRLTKVREYEDSRSSGLRGSD